MSEKPMTAEANDPSSHAKRESPLTSLVSPAESADNVGPDQPRYGESGLEDEQEPPVNIKIFSPI